MEDKENLIVEYLISISSKNIFNNCSTKEAFNSLLCSNEKIEIDGDKILYKELEINYTIQLSKNGKNTFFHMIFKCDEIEKLKLYEEFLRGIKCVLDKVSDNGVIVLWDDISAYYCKKSYPLINRVENTMRKLLTKFMMINIGGDWDKTVISDEIKKTITKKDNAPRSYDYLYQTDFITLSDFLFKEYPNKTYENFNKEIKKTKDISKFNIEDIIKKSNWDRYFKKIVNCDSEFLNTRWKELYELRCKVAHNNQLERKEYERIIELIEAINPKLEDVIKKLDQVNVDDDSKFRVVENMVENIHPDAMCFLDQYKLLEEILNILCIDNRLKVKSPVPSQLIKTLLNNDIVDEEIFSRIGRIIQFRNVLVHDMNFKGKTGELDAMLSDLIDCQKKLITEYEFKSNITYKV